MQNIYDKLNEFRASGKDAIIVTVTDKEGMGPCDVGKKMIVSEDNEAFGTIGGGGIEYYAREKCKTLLKERKSLSEKYILNDKDVVPEKDVVKLNMACGGTATLFYEFIGPKQYVYIFGAGHCGAALSRLLKKLDFYVTVIDSRKDVIDTLDESVDKKVTIDFAQYIEEYGLKENSYVVVSTPSHMHDFDVLDKILEKKISLKYFGMLCSKKKILDYLEIAYKKHGKDINLENMYSPIGLDIGGDSPEEVAVSIAGEILSIYYDKKELNSHMRNRVPDDKKYF